MLSAAEALLEAHTLVEVQCKLIDHAAACCRSLKCPVFMQTGEIQILQADLKSRAPCDALVFAVVAVDDTSV